MPLFYWCLFFIGLVLGIGVAYSALVFAEFYESVTEDDATSTQGDVPSITEFRVR